MRVSGAGFRVGGVGLRVDHPGGRAGLICSGGCHAPAHVRCLTARPSEPFGQCTEFNEATHGRTVVELTYNKHDSQVRIVGGAVFRGRGEGGVECPFREQLADAARPRSRQRTTHTTVKAR